MKYPYMGGNITKKRLLTIEITVFISFLMIALTLPNDVMKHHLVSLFVKVFRHCNSY